MRRHSWAEIRPWCWTQEGAGYIVDATGQGVGPAPAQRQATTVATEPSLIAHALREGWRANRWHDF
eukprot:10315525-Heterocapsa_arctica.AAC.1